jgi:hypothetical protein
MAHPFLDNLEQMSKLLRDLESVRERVGELPKYTDSMGDRKATAEVFAGELFDALVDYQRVLMTDYPMRSEADKAKRAANR